MRRRGYGKHNQEVFAERAVAVEGQKECDRNRSENTTSTWRNSHEIIEKYVHLHSFSRARGRNAVFEQRRR